MEAPIVSRVSSDRALVIWGPSKETGSVEIAEYELEYKEVDASDWISARKNVDRAFFVVRGLQPRTSYHFRSRAAIKLPLGSWRIWRSFRWSSDERRWWRRMSERRTSRLEGVETDEPTLDYSN